MNKKRFLIILILLIFTTGMLISTASASHTFKDKGYKYIMKTPELKKMKKTAKKVGYDVRDKKVSKTKNLHSPELLKIGKKYKLMGTNKKFKVLSLKKTLKSRGVGDGGYVYRVKQYAHIDCLVDYRNGKYTYSAVAYSR